MERIGDKWLTVNELIDVLSKHDPEMRVIVTRDGNDHSYPIIENEIKITTSFYFPDCDFEDLEENENVLRIALI